MLRIQHLQRLIDAPADRLLAALTDNGLPLPLPLRCRLADQPDAARALGLRRLLELTYRPDPRCTLLALHLARTLLQPEVNDTDDCEPTDDPLVLAALLAAMHRFVNAMPDLADEHAHLMKQACQHGWMRLALLQQPDGGFAGGTLHDADRTDADRTLTAAFVAYLLGGVQVGAQEGASFHLAACLGYVRRHQDTLRGDAHTLALMALAQPLPTAPHVPLAA